MGWRCSRVEEGWRGKFSTDFRWVREFGVIHTLRDFGFRAVAWDSRVLDKRSRSWRRVWAGGDMGERI